jgi:hypothetical protein
MYINEIKHIPNSEYVKIGARYTATTTMVTNTSNDAFSNRIMVDFFIFATVQGDPQRMTKVSC